MDHNITVLAYPPHCTHALQGLDVVCFAIAKKNWSKAVDAFMELHLRGINKSDFPSVWGGVFLASFREETNKTAFSVTGIWPPNRNAISPALMKPSELSSTKTVFALPLPSPARRIVQMIQLTTEEGNTINPHIAGNVDLTNQTKLTQALQSSPSGAFLVSSTRITSSQEIFLPVISPIPRSQEATLHIFNIPPNRLQKLSQAELLAEAKNLADVVVDTKKQLEVAQQAIEAANAQLVVQHIHATKLKQSLGEKEKKRAGGHTKIFGDGMGKVVTSDEIFKSIQELEEAKKAKSKELELREKERKRIKAAKVALAEWWKKAGDEHTAALTNWEATTKILKEQHVLRKDWPKKPTRALKKSWKEFLALNEAESSGDDEDEDEDELIDAFHRANN